MKKIFTLLFCVMAVAAYADDARIDQCINIVLGNENATMLTAQNFDVNNDAASSTSTT